MLLSFESLSAGQKSNNNEKIKKMVKVTRISELHIKLNRFQQVTMTLEQDGGLRWRRVAHGCIYLPAKALKLVEQRQRSQLQ